MNNGYNRNYGASGSSGSQRSSTSRPSGSGGQRSSTSRPSGSGGQRSNTSRTGSSGGQRSSTSRTGGSDGQRSSTSRTGGSDGQRSSTSRTGSSYRRSNAYRSPSDSQDRMPISVYIGMGVTAIAVIALILSISLGGKKNRSHRDADLTDDFSGGSYESQTQIVDFPEDDEESDDTVSSKTEIKSFIGTWYKQDAAASQKAVLTVTMQYEDSFEFRLEIWNGKESAVINATAFYSDETTAEYAPKKKAKLTLQYDTDHVSITHTGKNSAFGIGDDYVIDGQFTEQEPDYPEESTEVTYDYDIYRSDKVVQALKDTLSSDDYALYQDMMKNGLNSPINYERTLDKNGRQVNVDSELNAVKYYAHLSSTGTDMIFICSEDAKIYLLFYNSEEIIYCTNDKSYSSKMPASFQAVAKAKNIKPTFR